MIGISTDYYVTGVGSMARGAKLGAILRSLSESRTLGTKGKAECKSPTFPLVRNVQPFFLLADLVGPRWSCSSVTDSAEMVQELTGAVPALQLRASRRSAGRWLSCAIALTFKGLRRGQGRGRGRD